MTSSDLKIKTRKTFKMEIWPVNHFYCHLSLPGVMVPDKTAVANIAKIPASPCAATEYIGAHEGGSWGHRAEPENSRAWIQFPNYFSFF